MTPSQTPPQRTAQTVTEQLLGGMGVDDFMNRVFGKSHLHVAGALGVMPGTAALLTVDELHGLLRSPGVVESVDVTALGSDGIEATLVDAAEVAAASSEGAGLVVAGLERVLDDGHPLAAMFRSIESACVTPARGMTVFLSPEGAALPAHNDTYEVFTLQLHGRKRWRLFDLVSPALAVDPERVEAAVPVADVVLSPGDLLYMPKGQVHQVRPHEGLSLSVAMGYEPPSWLTMIEAVVAAVQHDPRFWQSIGEGDVRDDFEKRQAVLIKAVLDLDAEAFAGHIEAARDARISGSRGR